VNIISLTACAGFLAAALGGCGVGPGPNVRWNDGSSYRESRKFSPKFSPRYPAGNSNSFIFPPNVNRQ